jgi:hypothetical protein
MVVPYSFLSTFIRPIHSSSCLLIPLRNDLCWDQTPAAHLYAAQSHNIQGFCVARLCNIFEKLSLTDVLKAVYIAVQLY